MVRIRLEGAPVIKTMTSHFMKSDIDMTMTNKHTDRKRITKKPVFHPYEKKIAVNKNQKHAHLLQLANRFLRHGVKIIPLHCMKIYLLIHMLRNNDLRQKILHNFLFCEHSSRQL